MIIFVYKNFKNKIRRKNDSDSVFKYMDSNSDFTVLFIDSYKCEFKEKI